MWTLIDSYDGTIIGYANAVADVTDHPGRGSLVGDLILAPGLLDKNAAILCAIEIREDFSSLDDTLTLRDNLGE